MEGLPFAQEIEQAIIGALLNEGAAIDRLDGRIDVDDYYHEAHRIIFGHMRELHEQGVVFDLVSMANRLEQAGVIDKVGGRDYLVRLAASAPSAVQLTSYAAIVREKARLRALRTMATSVSQVLSVPGLEHSQDRLQKAMEILEQVAEAGAGKHPELLYNHFAEHTAVLEKRMTGTSDSISMGFADMDDRMAGGMRAGDLIIVGARPGMGKTAFTMQVASSVAMRSGPALILSQEMTSLQLVDRLISARSGVPVNKVTRGEGMTNDDLDRVVETYSNLAELPLYLDDQPALTLGQAISKIRRVKRQQPGLKLVVIDYLQLMSGTGRTDNRNQQLEMISRGLKAVAKQEQITVMALSQLSREVERRPNKRPMMSDLRDSGSIEADADVIAFLYRDEVYNPDTQDRGLAEVIITKNRFGAPGTTVLAFDAECVRFGPVTGLGNRRMP